jgi:hypothetical protein
MDAISEILIIFTPSYPIAPETKGNGYLTKSTLV